MDEKYFHTFDKGFLSKYKETQPNWGFNGLGYVVYKRTYSRDNFIGHKEEWWETIKRCIEGAQKIGASYTEKQALRLYDYIFNLKGSFSGRGLWQLGTELVDKIGGPSLLNCWFTDINSIEDFIFIMTHLSLGGGVGYSVQRAFIHELPKVKPGVEIHHLKTNDADFIVPDSRQGWAALLRKVLQSLLYTGESFTYSTILIRGYGAPLKTFGGTASGPEILVEGISEICKVVNSRANKKLRSIDVLDIANIIGKIIVAGSARRSAQIALGDPDDMLFLKAKDWSKGQIPAWRANSNNSIYADKFDEIVDTFWRGYEGNGEPYGLVNLPLSRKFGRLNEKVDDSKVNGFNPCSEITLEDKECCNLSEIFLPNISSKDELIDLAKLLYKTQKAITDLEFPYKETMEVIRKNRRLGLGITGWLQSSPEQISWLEDCYKELREFDKQWSELNDWNTSIKLTCVKPSGTLSLLAGVTPGVHPAYARYYIRRIRMGSNDPLVDYCRKLGYQVQFDVGIDGREDYTRYVVSFPCEAPEHAVLSKDLSAIEQLEWVVKAQTIWSDNAVSVTVYYKKEELPIIKEWLKNNYETKIKSVSFLLHSEHGFALAPYEEITKEQYDKIIEKIKPIVAFTDSWDGNIESVECAGGVCPIK